MGARSHNGGGSGGGSVGGSGGSGGGAPQDRCGIHSQTRGGAEGAPKVDQKKGRAKQQGQDMGEKLKGAREAERWLGEL